MKDTLFGRILTLDVVPADFDTRPDRALARLRRAYGCAGPVPVIARAATGRWSWNQLHNLRETLIELAGGGAAALVADARLRGRLGTTTVPRDIELFADLGSALGDRRFRAFALADASALVLAAGAGSRMRPLSNLWPKPMLPVLGDAAVDHIVTHLASFGISRIHANAAHLGDQIAGHFGPGRARLAPAVTVHAEGIGIGDRQIARPIGSAATLARLRDDLVVAGGPVVVVCGDAVCDLDLARMMAVHRDAGAAATVALRPVPDRDVRRYGIAETDARGLIRRFLEKPDPVQTTARSASAGIYIFEPEALALARDIPGQDIGTDLLPALAARGRLAGYLSDFTWLDLGNPRDLFAANRAAATGALGLRSRSALQLARGLWAEPGASVGSGIRIEVTTYVARGARVAAGAYLRGTNVIGACCDVAARTLVQDSLILPATRLAEGAVASGMIAWPGGAVRHALADGRSEVAALPLDRVSAVADDVAELRLA